MDWCVIDKMPEHRTPPHPEAIRQARDKQMAALREVRRLLARAHVVSRNPRPISR